MYSSDGSPNGVDSLTRSMLVSPSISYRPLPPITPIVRMRASSRIILPRAMDIERCIAARQVRRSRRRGAPSRRSRARAAARTRDLGLQGRRRRGARARRSSPSCCACSSTRATSPRRRASARRCITAPPPSRSAPPRSTSAAACGPRRRRCASARPARASARALSRRRSSRSRRRASTRRSAARARRASPTSASSPTSPSSPTRARAHLALGRILAGFGRHDEAVRHLQRARRVPHGDASRASARGACWSSSWPRSAIAKRPRALLDPLRAADPRLPPLDAFLPPSAARSRARRRRQACALGGRYRVARLLGSGGMGRVYLARDEFTGRDVAVKVVAPPVDARSADRLPPLRARGRRSSRRCSHPNIVAVVAFHEELGLLAMEFMAGGTLADRLRRAATAVAGARLVRSRCSAGLEAAHAHGVIHRDIKPANIFFAASGEAKLGDFGVAHLSISARRRPPASSARSRTCRPSRSRARRSPSPPTSTRSASRCSRRSPAACPSAAPTSSASTSAKPPPPPSTHPPRARRAWDAADRARAGEVARRSLRRRSKNCATRSLAIPVEPRDRERAEASAERRRRTRRATPSATPSPPSSTAALVHATDTKLGREVVIELLARSERAAPAVAARARAARRRPPAARPAPRAHRRRQHARGLRSAHRPHAAPAVADAPRTSSCSARSRRCTPPASRTDRWRPRSCSKITARPCSPQAAVRRESASKRNCAS